MKQNIRMSTIQNPPERERSKQNVYSNASQTVRLARWYLELHNRNGS